MDDIETRLRAVECPECARHGLALRYSECAVHPIPWPALAGLVQGMLRDALENVEPFISREGTKMVGPITQARVDLFWATLAALRATPETGE